MPTYTQLQIFYLSLHFISIFLTLLLIIYLFRSKPFITKWTLIQISLSLLGFSIFTISSLIIFGDQIEFEASNELCSVFAKITTFFLYPVISFSSVLSCYLWFLIVKANLNLENATLRYISAIIWGWSLVYVLFMIIMTRNERTIATVIYCKLQVKWYNYYIYWTVMSILILLNFVFGGHATYILYKRWNIFKNNKNRQTAINLGYSVRVATYISLYTFFMISYLLSDTISTASKNLLNKQAHVGDFTSALCGTFLFLIFGTTRSATLFMPCCYYSQPESLQLQCQCQDTQSMNSSTNTENVTIIDLSQEFVNHYNEN
ncbi:hypothetical protein Glove_22g165 [Diversispora epigaea]|uniref:G-protein coupled receptors family 2 profile 2 domain-containing protein n=1 Tax=Diversispora epigaea TaxID=1348612 RepID=A0A397JNN8_9GLOM|nr:hypothetical protein Glove_22g165 [Diversispora epigaea]